MCSMQPEIMLFFPCEIFMSSPHGLAFQPFSAIGTPTAKSLEKNPLVMYHGRAYTGVPANCF